MSRKSVKGPDGVSEARKEKTEIDLDSNEICLG